VFLAVLALQWSLVPALSGQASDGSTGSAVGTGILGAYSGAVLGLVAATAACDRVLVGPLCPRAAATTGGTVGLVAGVILGSNDSTAPRDRLTGAGYGALAGGLVGLGLSAVVRQYGRRDLLAISAVGAAIGTSPKGAGVGFATGAAVGALSWLVFPSFKVGEAISAAVLGLAVGGVVEWVSDAANSASADAAPVGLSFSVPLGSRVP
jgi:hypothetical protein